MGVRDLILIPGFGWVVASYWEEAWLPVMERWSQTVERLKRESQGSVRLRESSDRLMATGVTAWH
jgi:hypothetical protein